MPALAADIQAASRAAVFDTQSDTAVSTLHKGARDTGAAPRGGNWDALADAATLNAAAFAFWKVARRRFSAGLDGVQAMTGALSPISTTPAVTLIDTETAVNGLFAIADFELDLDAESTTFELIG